MLSPYIRATYFFSLLALSSPAWCQNATPTTYAQAIPAGRAQFQGGDYVGAQKSMEQALALATNLSEKAEAMIRVGLTYNKRGLYAQARSEWAKVLQLPEVSTNDKLQVLFSIACSYGDWSASRIELQKVVDTPEASPEDKGTALLAIAVTWLGEEKEIEARREFSTIAKDEALGSNFRVLAYTQLAQNLMDARQFDAARTALTDALALPGISTELAMVAQNQIGKSYQAEGNKEKARMAFIASQDIAMQKTNLLADQKQYDAALILSEQCFALGNMLPPLDAQMRMYIGENYHRQKRYDEARKWFTQVVEKHYESAPEDENTIRSQKQLAQLEIAGTYEAEKNKEQGLKALEYLFKMEGTSTIVRSDGERMKKRLSQP